MAYTSFRAARKQDRQYISNTVNARRICPLTLITPFLRRNSHTQIQVRQAVVKLGRLFLPLRDDEFQITSAKSGVEAFEIVRDSFLGQLYVIRGEDLEGPCQTKPMNHVLPSDTDLESHVFISVENPSRILEDFVDVFRAKFLEILYRWAQFIFHVIFQCAKSRWQ